MSEMRRRIVLLVDGMHTAELLAALDRVCAPADAELLLVYVHGPAARRGLDLVRHRPGGAPMPGHRRRAIDEAEDARGGHALDEAERIARPLCAAVRRIDVHDDPGRGIVAVALREHADLIAVRALRGHLGPAARFIADHARCSVVVLRVEA
jgi:nucleotide-binding universal stress UspA family protein